MTKESVAHVRPGAGALARRLLALADWRRCLAERRCQRLGQRHIDRMSDHMLKDIGLSRRDAGRNETNWRR